MLPSLALGDGGMLWWPQPVHLNQSAQNAIVAWNKQEEIILLSVDITASEEATVLRVIPLPSNPSEIEEGEFESFETLVRIMNEKKINDDQIPTYGKNEGLGDASPGVEITFHEQIGAHDITVVKVNDLNIFITWIEDFAIENGLGMTEEINCSDYDYSDCPEGCRKDSCPSICPPGAGACPDVCGNPVCIGGKIATHRISQIFRNGVENYLKREIYHFVFDVIDAGQEKESIKPISYRFDTDYLYFPILISGISGISESHTNIDLFLITPKDIEFPNPPYSYRKNNWFNRYGVSVEFSQEELKEVSENMADLFSSEVNVQKASLYGQLKNLTKDLMLFPFDKIDKNMGIGSRGEEVKVLQKILINEGLWSNKTGASGYFDANTKKDLIRFQEKYNEDILKPIKLSSGTGYFGPKTRDYLENLSLDMEKPSISAGEVKFTRNLWLGARGDDVKALQNMLIQDGVWQSGVSATGYFGPITKSAVIRYQEKYRSEILSPLRLSRGTGFVGASTRTRLQK